MRLIPLCECHNVPMRWHKDRRLTAGGRWFCRIRRNEYLKALRATDKGKEELRRYRQSPKGRAANERYKKSDKGKRTKYAYSISEAGKAARARYDASHIRVRLGDSGSTYDAFYKVNPKEKSSLIQKLAEFKLDQKIEYQEAQEDGWFDQTIQRT